MSNPLTPMVDVIGHTMEKMPPLPPTNTHKPGAVSLEKAVLGKLQKSTQPILKTGKIKID